MSKILITGGARSGKSRFAQELAKTLGEPVLFVATAQPLDEEMAKRIKEHQKTRPKSWRTLEITRHVGRELRQKIGGAKVVIIDCITLLVGNIFSELGGYKDEQIDVPLLTQVCLSEVEELINFMKESDTSFIIVTNEVGEGIVPVDKISRLYRDILGLANQKLAEEADTVYFMIAGLPLKIKPAS